MRLVLVCAALAIIVLGAAACSTTVPRSYLPVDSPLHAWAAPEQDEPAAPAPAPAPAPSTVDKKPAAPKKK